MSRNQLGIKNGVWAGDAPSADIVELPNFELGYDSDYTGTKYPDRRHLNEVLAFVTAACSDANIYGANLPHDPLITYEQHAVVMDGAVPYRSLVAANLGNTPSSSPSQWTVFVPEIPNASQTVKGIIEIATQSEVDAGTDITLVVTPKTLRDSVATESKRGVAEIATQAEVDAGTDDERFITPLKLKERLIVNYLHVRDEKFLGFGGGDFVSGSWVERTLNTEKTNSITGASLASNQITLPAGTYRIRARAPAYGNVNRHKARLWNVTDSDEIIYGSNASGTTDASSDSFIVVEFTLASTKVLAIEHRCETTVNNDGLGKACAFFGAEEVYTEVEIWKFV